jgi:glycine cleavage system H protein
VVEINGDLPKSPELVNQDPYGRGWMIVIKPSHAGERNELLSAPDYEKLLAESGH